MITNVIGSTAETFLGEAAAVPTRLLEQLTLIGPPDKIRHDLEAWRDSIVTTLLVGGDAATLRAAAEIVLG